MTIDPRESPQRYMEAARDLWASAPGWMDICALQASWLEGTVPLHPQNYAVGPAPETAPLVPLLAELNRKGILTDVSQPGRPLVGGSGQRAWLEGYCTMAVAELLNQRVAGRDGLVYFYYSYFSLPDVDQSPSIVVTLDGGAPFTFAGRGSTQEDLIDQWGFLHEAAYGVLARTAQFVIFDADFGRDDRLWEFVEEATRDYQFARWDEWDEVLG